MGILKNVLLYKVLFILAGITGALDQYTKFLVEAHIPAGTYFSPDLIEVVPNWLNWVHVHNTGAAWGQFAGNSTWLALFAVIVLGAIFYFRESLELKILRVQVAFGLLIGGVLGNVADRVRLGYVVDFIDIPLGGLYRWPAFNVADIGIVVGVMLYLFYSFTAPKKS